jgi:hypothetical protein
MWFFINIPMFYRQHKEECIGPKSRNLIDQVSALDWFFQKGPNKKWKQNKHPE